MAPEVFSELLERTSFWRTYGDCFLVLGNSFLETLLLTGIGICCCCMGMDLRPPGTTVELL